jgi:hypothetical protein
MFFDSSISELEHGMIIDTCDSFCDTICNFFSGGISSDIFLLESNLLLVFICIYFLENICHIFEFIVF